MAVKSSQPHQRHSSSQQETPSAAVISSQPHQAAPTLTTHYCYNTAPPVLQAGEDEKSYSPRPPTANAHAPPASYSLSACHINTSALSHAHLFVCAGGGPYYYW